MSDAQKPLAGDMDAYAQTSTLPSDAIYEHAVSTAGAEPGDSRSATPPGFDVAQLLKQLFAPFPPLKVLRGEQHLSPGQVYRLLF